MTRRRFDASRASGGLFPPPGADGSALRRPAEPGATPQQWFSSPPPDLAQASLHREERDLTVTMAARLVDEALSGMPRPLRIVGQIGSLSHRTHWYFNLKDEQSVIQCVLWASRAARSAPLREGDEVRVSGVFSFHAPSGRASFIVESIEPRGVGSLEARFRALCAELKALGWFDEARKPPLPLLPRRIAIITSRSGAALRDCLSTAASRCPCVDILVVDVPVQGEGAAEAVAHAIGAVDAHAASLGIDAILVTRGGGSREDLWTFNERIVAEAAFRCRTPLVAAIGHEPDLEIIELVAHRAATPTRGIVMLLPDRSALRAELEHRRVRMARAQRRRIEIMRQQVAALGRHDLLRRPAQAVLAAPRARLAELRFEIQQRHRQALAGARGELSSIAVRVERMQAGALIAQARQRVRHLRFRVAGAARAALTGRWQALASIGRHLEGIGPERVLARGYSITRLASGAIVRDSALLQRGDRLVTLLARGSAESEVRAVRSDPGGALPRSIPSWPPPGAGSVGAHDGPSEEPERSC